MSSMAAKRLSSVSILSKTIPGLYSMFPRWMCYNADSLPTSGAAARGARHAARLEYWKKHGLPKFYQGQLKPREELRKELPIGFVPAPICPKSELFLRYQLRFFSPLHHQLEAFCIIIRRMAWEMGLTPSGIIHIPTQIYRFPLLRSPFKHATSMQHFDMIHRKRLINIYNCPPKAGLLFINWIHKNLPPMISLSVKEHKWELLDGPCPSEDVSQTLNPKPVKVLPHLLGADMDHPDITPLYGTREEVEEWRKSGLPRPSDASTWFTVEGSKYFEPRRDKDGNPL